MEKRQAIESMYRTYKESFPEVPDLTPEELLAAEEAGDVVVVDVREDEERQVSTLPGAISRQDLEAHKESYRDRRIVTYCTIGYRSGLYAQTLRQEGFDAYNLKGSILAWTHAGQPLESAQGPTKKLHVYGPTWDLAAQGYETVW